MTTQPLQSFAAADHAALAAANGANGLPDALTLDHLTAAGIRVDPDATGTDTLGTERVAATWVAVHSDVYEGGLRAWMRDDHVVLLEGQYPITSDGEPIAADAISDPERRLDTYLGRVLLESAELVYSKQGLTMRVNPDNAFVLSMYLYPTTTADEYEQTLRPMIERGERR